MRSFREERKLPTTSARELALTVFIRGCRSTSRMDVGSIPTLLHNMEMAGKWPTNASTTLFWNVNKKMKGWGGEGRLVLLPHVDGGVRSF